MSARALLTMNLYAIQAVLRAQLTHDISHTRSRDCASVCPRMHITQFLHGVALVAQRLLSSTGMLGLGGSLEVEEVRSLSTRMLERSCLRARAASMVGLGGTGVTLDDVKVSACVTNLYERVVLCAGCDFFKCRPIPFQCTRISCVKLPHPSIALSLTHTHAGCAIKAIRISHTCTLHDKPHSPPKVMASNTQADLLQMELEQHPDLADAVHILGPSLEKIYEYFRCLTVANRKPSSSVDSGSQSSEQFGYSQFMHVSHGVQTQS